MILCYGKKIFWFKKVIYIYVKTAYVENSYKVPKNSIQDRSHQWSTRPAHSPGRQWLSLDFEVLGRTDVRTLCVKIVITNGRDCGLPRGSIFLFSVHSSYIPTSSPYQGQKIISVTVCPKWLCQKNQLIFNRVQDMRVINDPLDQTLSPASSDQYSCLNFWFWNVGMDGRT